MLRPIPAPLAVLLLAPLCSATLPRPGAAAPASGEAILSEATARVSDIDTDGLRALLAERPETVLIDVRTPREISALGGTIDAPNNVNIPRGWLEMRIADAVLDADTPIVVYCGINQRSPLAAATLMDMGYRNVSNYAEGVFAWRDAGLPMEVPDRARHSFLYDLPREVVDGVWSAIGATAPPTYDNSGHNNNLSFVIGDDAVLVVNAGDNDLLARALHEEIRRITDRPVRYVVLENGQGHAMLGSNYWQEQGATVIAHVDAAEEIAAHGAAVLERMRKGRRDKALGTELAMPDETFEERRVIDLGGRRVELRHLGPAHSPGDIVVWLPAERLVITGDVAFHQRLLPVFEHTDTAAWIETWPRLAALEPVHVIPGHGEPTDLAEVTRYTLDYLVYMRQRMAEIIDAGGSLTDAYRVDQSAFSHLDTFDELAKQNAGRIFRAMEFE